MHIYYFILENYSLFGKHKGNTHLFMIPISDNRHIYVGLLGEIEGNKSHYASKLIVQIPSRLIHPVIEGEKKYFGEKFKILEKIPCSVTEDEEGIYSIVLKNKGKYLKSDLTVKFSQTYSSYNMRIYTIWGKLSFKSENIKTKMELNKMSKLLSTIGVKKSPDNSNNLNGGKEMSSDDKIFEGALKLFLLDVIKESKVLENNLKKDEIIEMGIEVNNMKLSECVSIILNLPQNATIEEIREEEGNFKKAVKYTAAAAGGAYAITHPEKMKAIGSAITHPKKIKAIGKDIIFSDKFRKTKGAAAAVAGLYLYRKLSDPCVRKGLLHIHKPAERREVVKKCRMEAARKVINQLRKNMGGCVNASNPPKCKAKYAKEIEKWNKKLAEITSKN